MSGGTASVRSREQLAEPGVEQRAVVEVRPEGHDHAEPALRVGGRATRSDSRNSSRSPLVGGEREDLLELVDHEHDLRLAGRDEIDGLEQAPGPGIEQVAQPRDRTHRDPKERGLELLDRVRLREHLGDEGIFRVPEDPSADRRNESRADHRGLSAPARADDGQEPGSGPGLAQPGDEAPGELAPPEEVARRRPR